MPNTLYVSHQGAVVRRTSQRILVDLHGHIAQSIRLREVERLVLFGHVQLTASAMTALLQQGVETTLLSYGGAVIGRLTPQEPKDVFIRRAQYLRLADEEFRLRTARAIVSGKIRNARGVIVRHARNHPDLRLDQAAERLATLRARCLHASSRLKLLGLEGESAHAYFAALGRMTRREMSFTTRSRRPPRDPFNALLSFGYALLTSECAGALFGQGLDPRVGLMHELDYGRPSLACDLVEELRHPAIDRMCLTLVNRGVLTLQHFTGDETRGYLLDDCGRELFLSRYHALMEPADSASEPAQTVSKPRGAAGIGGVREIVLRQAARMRKAIETGAPYRPYRAGA